MGTGETLAFKVFAGLPIDHGMDISGVSPGAAAMATSAQGREIKRQAAVMNKAKDVAEMQAQSLIQLVKDANVGTRLNVYA